MMHYARMVLGYHGCDALVAEQLLQGTTTFKASENAYDWLDRGVYFWEHGPDRAWQWATAAAERDRARPPTHRAPISTPAVVGAIIHLGSCFDLLDTANTEALAEWAPIYRAALDAQGLPFPQNRGPSPLRPLRDGDCALINSYIALRAQHGVRHDSVRGCFLEGEPIYLGSGIQRLAHIQIAVREPACIVGTFRPMIRQTNAPATTPTPG